MNFENYNIIVTSAAHQAPEIAEKIKALGANPILLPCIEIEFLSIDLDILNQNFDSAIFLSPNSVLSLTHRFSPSNDDKLTPLKHCKISNYFAIGQKTAEKAHNLVNNKIIFPQKNNETSEGLLELDELNNIKNNKIIIFKGQYGRDLLIPELKKRGAIITEIDTYRRKKPKNINYEILEKINLEQTIIILNSCEVIDNLLSDLPDKLKNKVLNTQISVRSERIKNHATKYGFTKIWIKQIFST